MISMLSLWLPIVLAAVVVFVASSVLHMMLPFHRNDFRRIASEDEVMGALRRFNIAPGDYQMPCPSGQSSMRDPAFVEKMRTGPMAIVTVLDPAKRSMGRRLALWFVYTIVVGVFAAYITSRALAPGTAYLQVFRFAGCTAFIGYALALWQNTIWYDKSIATTLRSTIDGLIYGLLTGGVFGWLWPH